MFGCECHAAHKRVEDRQTRDFSLNLTYIPADRRLHLPVGGNATNDTRRVWSEVLHIERQTHDFLRARNIIGLVAEMIHAGAASETPFACAACHSSLMFSPTLYRIQLA